MERGETHRQIFPKSMTSTWAPLLMKAFDYQELMLQFVCSFQDKIRSTKLAGWADLLG